MTVGVSEKRALTGGALPGRFQGPGELTPCDTAETIAVCCMIVQAR